MDRRSLLKLLPKVSLGALFAGWNILKDEPEPVEAVEAPGVVEVQRIQEFIREDVYSAFKSSGSDGMNVTSSSAMCVQWPAVYVDQEGFIVPDYTSSDVDLRSGYISSDVDLRSGHITKSIPPGPPEPESD